MARPDVSINGRQTVAMSSAYLWGEGRGWGLRVRVKGEGKGDG